MSFWSCPRTKAWRHPIGERLVEGVQRGGDCAPFGHGAKGSRHAPIVDGISQGSGDALPLILLKEAMGLQRESEVSLASD